MATDRFESQETQDDIDALQSDVNALKNKSIKVKDVSVAKTSATAGDAGYVTINTPELIGTTVIALSAYNSHLAQNLLVTGATKRGDNGQIYISFYATKTFTDSSNSIGCLVAYI